MAGPLVKVIVLRTAGTNCDREMVFAFASLGAAVELVHINRLFSRDVRLSDFHILAIPGGFTYGDDIMSGRILANELRIRLSEEIKDFVHEGKLILGVCNGFQVLVRAGILPGSKSSSGNLTFQQTVSLSNNDSGKFEDRWIHLRLSGDSVWTKGLDEMMYVPVAHAEGKFVVSNEDILNQLKKNNQIVFRYCNTDGEEGGYPVNPNGSIDDIAGITDPTGRILGMMPHPERHFSPLNHPAWTRKDHLSHLGQGANIFLNGVRYAREQLLGKTQVAVAKG